MRRPDLLFSGRGVGALSVLPREIVVLGHILVREGSVCEGTLRRDKDDGFSSSSPFFTIGFLLMRDSQVYLGGNSLPSAFSPRLLKMSI